MYCNLFTLYREYLYFVHSFPLYSNKVFFLFFSPFLSFMNFVSGFHLFTMATKRMVLGKRSVANCCLGILFVGDIMSVCRLDQPNELRKIYAANDQLSQQVNHPR